MQLHIWESSHLANPDELSIAGVAIERVYEHEVDYDTWRYQDSGDLIMYRYAQVRDDKSESGWVWKQFPTIILPAGSFLKVREMKSQRDLDREEEARDQARYLDAVARGVVCPECKLNLEEVDDGHSEGCSIGAAEDAFVAGKSDTIEPPVSDEPKARDRFPIGHAADYTPQTVTPKVIASVPPIDMSDPPADLRPHVLFPDDAIISPTSLTPVVTPRTGVPDEKRNVVVLPELPITGLMVNVKSVEQQRLDEVAAHLDAREKQRENALRELGDNGHRDHENSGNVMRDV